MTDSQTKIASGRPEKRKNPSIQLAEALNSKSYASKSQHDDPLRSKLSNTSPVDARRVPNHDRKFYSTQSALERKPSKRTVFVPVISREQSRRELYRHSRKPSSMHSSQSTANATSNHRKKISLSQAFSKAAKHGMSTGFLFTEVDTIPGKGKKNAEMTVEEMDELEVAKEELQTGYWWLVPLVCTMFFVTKTFQPLLLEWNEEDGSYPFRPSTSIWASRVILTVFFGLWLLYDRDAIKAKEWQISLPFIPVAICTVANVLSIYLTVEFLGAGTYAVLKNLNLVLTAILIYFWLQKPVSPAQWSCVLIITLATFIFRVSFLKGDTNLGYLFVLIGIIASTLEGILLQIVTRKLARHNMTFQKQSFFYHFYSLILSFILMITYDYETVFYTKLGPFDGWNYKVGVYLVCILPLVSMKHAVAGLASAIMVKLIVAGTTVSTFVLAIWLFDESVTVTRILSAIIICVALVCYQLEGARLTDEMALRLTFLNGRIKTDETASLAMVGGNAGNSKGTMESKSGGRNPLKSTSIERQVPSLKSMDLVIQCTKCYADVCTIPTNNRMMNWISESSQAIRPITPKSKSPDTVSKSSHPLIPENGPYKPDLSNIKESPSKSRIRSSNFRVPSGNGEKRTLT